MPKQRNLKDLVVLIKSGGELGSAIAHRLARCHFKLCLTEAEHPLAVTRGVTFSEAVFDGTKEIEGITARLIKKRDEIAKAWAAGEIPLIVDPTASVRDSLKPDVLVDAIMAKKNTGTTLNDAPWVIGIGPGFRAGQDVHAVIETNQNNNLGKVILGGEPEKDTTIPVALGGYSFERVIHAPVSGVFTARRELGDSVPAGEVIAFLGDLPLKAEVPGIIRGLIRSGLHVEQGTKVLEIDPVARREDCWKLRGAPRAVAGGVLEAILMHYNT